jgi:hypothetical protein
VSGESLDELYFRWRYDRVRLVQDPDSAESYVALCEVLDDIIFVWVVPNDDNRAADGVEIRRDFLLEKDLDEEHYDQWMAEPPSVFEVLVGLVQRANYIAELGEVAWFEMFLMNLDLIEYSDKGYLDSDKHTIAQIVGDFIDREYRADGKGGIFPLQHPMQDQRKIELWYQMAAYINENGLC